ncbi:Aste57867_6039 [Aphanomyces stellatus]|uniref:Aste57867_6039 protein n=1 Tax=Aphanomyces stellatus TaxID=120398 RepID=A0A485KHQ0_9STRA|nr:hypothetical protein As57867_006025 [Aphanomyces stellatus]VFT83052.1 Aste57867_6039 [Aphanomyces stellatus]
MQFPEEHWLGGHGKKVVHKEAPRKASLENQPSGRAINMLMMSNLMKKDETLEAPAALPALAMVKKFVEAAMHKKAHMDAAKKKSAMLFGSVLDDDFILNMSQAKVRNITRMKESVQICLPG